MHPSLAVAFAIVATGVSAAPVGRAICDINACVVALQPAFPACAPAVTAQGANTASNTACLTAAAQGTAAFPTPCIPCAPQFGVTNPADNTQGTASNSQGTAAGNAGNASNSPGTAGASQGTTAGSGSANNGNGGSAQTQSGTQSGAQSGAAVSRSPQARASTCDIKACADALVPSFPDCAPAVAAQGASGPSNSACLAAAAQGTASFPATCSPCAAQFGVTDPGNKAKAPRRLSAAPLSVRATCDVKACVIALGPAFPACAPAVSAQGANVPSNTACLAAAAQGTAPFPSSCSACAAQFGVTDPANKENAPSQDKSPRRVGAAVSGA